MLNHVWSHVPHYLVRFGKASFCSFATQVRRNNQCPLCRKEQDPTIVGEILPALPAGAEFLGHVDEEGNPIDEDDLADLGADSELNHVYVDMEDVSIQDFQRMVPGQQVGYVRAMQQRDKEQWVTIC